MTKPPDDDRTELLAIADQMRRLRPDWRSLEPFYEKRSDLAARVRAIANGTMAPRVVTKLVPIPVPAPAPPPEVTSQAPAPPPPPEGTMPLFLNTQERAILAHAITTTTGGFHSGFKRWHAATDPVTGRLDLPQDDLKRVWAWGSRPWKGGGQSYARKIFWRSVGGMFTALDMVPETGEVTAAPNPHRRFSKKAGAASKTAVENGQDTPAQDALDGGKDNASPGHSAADEGHQDAQEGRGGPCAS